MKIKDLDLSITEQFIILQLIGNKFIKNKKIKIGDSKIYVLASILVDLSLNDKISFDGNEEITIKNDGLTGIYYNDMVLNLIKSKGVISLKKCTEYFYLHSKLLENMYNSIIERVVKKGVLEIEKVDSFFSTSKKTYIDYKNIGDFLIERLRIDLLENGNVDMDTMYLAILLDSNKTLMCYFSEYEYSIIKDKMKKIYEKDESNKFKIIKKSINNIEAISILNLVIDIISSFI